MNVYEELRWLIEDRWNLGSVPNVIIDQERQEQNMGLEDYVVIEERGGGDHERTLNQQKQKTWRMSVLARTGERNLPDGGGYNDPLDRLYGEFDEGTRSHTDGMTNEIERIFDEAVDGGPNFDIIIPDSGWTAVESDYKIRAARIDIDLRHTEYL